MRRRLPAIAVLLAGLLLPASAGAAVGRFVGGEVVDGPSADIQRLGDLDVASDGTGGLAYVKRDGGVDHIFVSRLVGGRWQGAERVDGPFTAPGSQPVLAAGAGGSLVIAYISGGALVTVTRPAAGQPYTAPELVATAASNPSVDLSINDLAYVSFTTPGGGGGDVMVARKDRGSPVFAVVPALLDIAPDDPAGLEGGRSKVAVAADGVALVVWGEAGQIFARRVFVGGPSAAPQNVTVPDLQGHAGGAGDVPDVDVQFDSSFAWVVFRQAFEDGAGGIHTRALARKLVGGSFDPPIGIDGLGFPIADNVGPPRVDISGRGDGYAGSATTATALGAVLKDKTFRAGVPLGPGAAGAALPVPAVDEGGDGLVAWLGADGRVHARAYDNVPASRRVQAPGRDASLSNPAGGPVDAPSGLEAAADRAGDVAIAFVQGAPGAPRAIVAAAFDRAPGLFRLGTASGWQSASRTRPLRWTSAFELWGPITYSVVVDGRVVARTTGTAAALSRVRDGRHRWRVIATDRRGQSRRTPTRVVLLDRTRPRAAVALSGSRRRGATIAVSVRARDPRVGRRRIASGLGRVQIAWGDRARTTGLRGRHRYRAGRYTLRVSVRDRAGNRLLLRRSLTIR